MPTHIRARLRSQKHRRSLEILRRAPSPSRNPLTDTPQPLRVVQQRLIHIRGNIPRRNTVDRNAPRSPLIRKRLGHLRHPALTRRIRRHRNSALEREQTAKVDDAALAAQHRVLRQLEHVRGDVAAEREGRVEVDLQHLEEVGVGELLGGVAALDASAVDEDADLVAVGENGGDEGGDGGGGSEVGGVDVRLAT